MRERVTPGGVSWSVAAVAVLTVTAIGCSPGPSQDAQPGQPLNVLLITIDTLRADAIGAFGSAGGGTPWMDRLATSGVRFDRARGHNVLTLPSHANILAGRLPSEHGVRDNSGFRFPADQATLATILKARGYRTGAFVSAFPLDSRFGLDRGFDVYDDSFADARPGRAFLLQERKGADTAALARRWMDERSMQPYFCWVHLFEPHYPYSKTYADDVAAADAAVGPLIEPILAAGSGSPTMVILTSDHGESLGEHGEETHGIFAYESTLRVPLVLYHPRVWKPQVIAEGGRHIDILPTVLAALSIPAPEGLPGMRLLAASAPSAPSASSAVYFEALSGALNRGWAPLRGVVRDELKFIDLPIRELYDLRADPAESRNLASERPDVVKEMGALLGTFDAATAAQGRTPASPDTQARLRSLGYVTSGAGATRTRYTQADDPKTLIPLDKALNEVTALYLAGDLGRAAARCRELVQRRPTMTISRIYLAQIERERGNLAGAIAALRPAAASNPHDVETVSLLAASLTEAGRARDAVALIEPLARQDAPDLQVLTAYGLGLARLGRTDEALAALDRARAQDPSNARLLVETGTVRMIANDRAGARKDFEAALQRNPELARAHSSLGVIAADERNLPQAIEHWGRAVKLDPREYRTVLGVGSALARAGRTVEARAYFDFLAASSPPPEYAAEIDRARLALR
jgi:arylsulfatase A-like enzyme/cytochrome c-type biogenesis protein CcmH/NrfG